VVRRTSRKSRATFARWVSRTRRKYGAALIRKRLYKVAVTAFRRMRRCPFAGARMASHAPKFAIR
jgi:hypothetical protein